MAAYLHFTVTTQQVSIPVNAGETFSIGVTVTNDEEASRTVELRLKDHNNKVVDSLINSRRRTFRFGYFIWFST